MTMSPLGNKASLEEIARQVGQLSPERRKLFLQLLAKQGIDLSDLLILPQDEDRSIFPLSFAQRRLWFLDQFEPNTALYNIPLALRLEGVLDSAVLRRALSEIVRRHEVLRARFAARDGEPYQVIADAGLIDLPVTDLTTVAADQRDAEALRLAMEEARQPFDLGVGPLLRARLLRLEAERHVALLTMHHIVADGWSAGVLVREVAALYAAYAQGQPEPLPPLPIQYTDFACWQEEHQRNKWQDQLEYWRQKLAGAPALLELPADHRRPPVLTYRGATESFHVPPDVAQKLAALSQDEGGSLFMTLLAAFQSLLYRYSGQDDICVGTPIANRNRRQTEGLIGFFVNTLVMRSRMADENLTFRALLRQVRDTALEAYEHQDLPFEVLVEGLQPERSASHAPLFQVMFALQNAPVGALELPGLTIAPLDVHSGVAKFDLTLVLYEEDGAGGGGLGGTMEYNTDLWDAPTIRRMLDHFTTLLVGIAADADRPLHALPLLTEAEREQLLVAWNDTEAPYPAREGERELCMHEWVEQQVRRTPQAVALTFTSGGVTKSLTFGEMDKRANRLAHFLRERGVGPNVLVGLCVERSLELIVGMLGILKAGGAYVPLDPAYPPERLAFMLGDISSVASDISSVAKGPGAVGLDPTIEATHKPARVLLTQVALAPRLPPYEGDVIYLDRDWDRIEAATAGRERGAKAPISGVRPDHLAYVIFTSGSTGRPKGTLLHHRGLCNVMRVFLDLLEPQPGERMLQFYSPSFDGSLAEIFATLVAGGTLCLAPREVLSSPPDLWKLFRDQEINMAIMAPAMWGALPSEGLAALRVGLSGGEALPMEVAERWAAQCRFVNVYGPTEATIIVSAYAMPDADTTPQENTVELAAGRGGVVSIGRPTRNSKIYLLDAHRQPVPVGVPGELHIAGMQLARGYLNRPDLTADKFVPDPFAVGARMYKSGDLARYLPDGNIEFLGRIDQQVKIRGFRIELGEIEAVLEQQPGVQQVVVIPREDTPGEKRLVAYVILHHDTPELSHNQADGVTGAVLYGADMAAKARLQEALQAKLPSYMVPAALVFLDAIPMTPNGKVDRRALPAPDWSAPSQTYVAPRTPIEGILVELWKQALGVERVGVQDSFFDLGGHSLLATQLVSRVQQALRVELPLRELFERPTVAELAERVEAILREGQGLARPPIEPAPDATDLPLSYAQQRMWFLDQLEPNTPLYNIPAAFRFRGALDLAALRASVSEIVARHDVLRASFPTLDGKPRQVIAPRGAMEVPLVDLSALPDEAREREALRLAQVEASTPFDLSRGPLLRVQVLRLAEQEHLVLLTMHHIVSDGWSGQVFVRELGALYQAYLGGAAREEHPLPPLEIQYADYARWQQAWLRGDVLDKQRAYWLAKLAGAPPTLDLPTDHPRPALQSWHGEHRAFDLDEELTSALRRLSRVEGATLFMTLLAAFKALLYRYSGQADISVGTPIANRNHPQVEGLIGFFVNTLVMRDMLDGEAGFRDLLRQVRETALGAYMHQDVPFEMLVDALQAERDTSHTPLFQVMFSLQSAPDRDAAGAALPGLAVEPVDVDPPVSMFDLTLVVSEDQERLRAGLEYNSDLWEPETIERLIAHFQTLLSHLVAEPDRPILALPWLTAQEREQVLWRWNDTDCAFASPAETMHQLFEAAAARTPQAIALVCGGQRLTYASLNARANHLARDLGGRGVRPETLVGLCAERSVQMVVGLLGILKAGGAYVPLDPGYPPERLDYMIRDSGLRIVVAAGDAANAAFDGLQVIRLDAGEEAAEEKEASANPSSGVGPRHAAYVIYTSGSTGQPKGVVVEHGSVVNHNLAAARLFRLTADDRILQFSTINFDAAVEEMFPAWAVGATVVLRPGGMLISGEELLDLVEREKLTVLDLPTAYWHEWVYELGLLQAGGAQGHRFPASLRLMVVGGDKASAEHVVRWREMAGPNVAWMNTYGPTEGTIIASSYELDAGAALPAPLPIGRPLPNVRLYILDSRGEPVPVGVPGELCIAGAGVARGYLNRPDLTAERFAPDPFYTGRGPSRMYHTGDLARFLPDGNIEFLGRNDDQVKIRGFRVELGEIERALKQRDDVRDAVVVARDGATPGAAAAGHSKRLVAYVVGASQNGAQPLTGPALRAYLQSKLPDYMVPSTYVLLEHLPLTATGKVDRRALPWPVRENGDPAAALSLAEQDQSGAPRTPQEQALARIWAEVLGLERVGVNDNFFELGGDSILSIQVIARANQAGLRLTPKQLFQAPTVAALAAACAAGPGDATADEEAEQGILEGSAPLLPIQSWFFEQRFAGQEHWNQALLLQTNRPLSPARLQRAVSLLVRQHDALRLRFRETAAGWEQWYAPEDAVPFAAADWSGLAEPEQAVRLESEAAALQASLSLAQGPLFRCHYWDLGEERGGRLMLVGHHLVVDGVSWRILLEDLQSIYAQLERGEDSAALVALPPKSASYRRWALKLAEHARNEALASQAPYWRQVVARPALLPVDDSLTGDAVPSAVAARNTEDSARNLTVSLEPAETQDLLQKAPAAYHTEINDVLLAALAQALADWTGERETVIALEGHGREDLFPGVDLSRTVGWFTSLYPVRLALPARGGPGELLKSVKEQLRQVPDKGIGYGLLRYLHPDEALRESLRMDDAAISFNYLGQFDQILAPAAALRPAPESTGPSFHPAARRAHLLDINIAVEGGTLRVTWTYSENVHRRETVEALAGSYLRALRTLIAHCLAPEAGGYTASDFALAGLDQRGLDKVLGKAGRSRERGLSLPHRNKDATK